MDLTKSFRISWRSITGHKLRSSLTTLGVVIGVGSVVAFMVMGGGFMQDVLADADIEEEPTLSVQTQSSASTGFGWQLSTSPVYTETDIRTIREMEGVEYVAPDGWLQAAQLSRGEQSIVGDFNARATIPAYLEQRGLVTGEPFDGPDEAVINRDLASGFAENVTVGETVSVTLEDGTRENLTVAGIVDDGDSGQNAQPTVYVHVEHHYDLTIETPRGTQEHAYPFLEVRAESVDAREDVQDSVRTYLREESDASRLKQADYDIRVLTDQEQAQRFEDVIDQITVFVAGIAGISLLVGSIGIANIMIVSVTERTGQIGIMKAIGARKRDVVQLFVVESVVLGVIGSVLGVLFGLGLGYVAVSMLEWPMVYPLDWIGIAVAVGVAVGVVSGLYPAWRAARVDPIEALRRE